MSGAAILVTGATGFIGRYLVDALVADGAIVRVLTRGDKRLPDAWRERVQVATGDLTHPDSLSRAVSGCAAVYHLAGELRAANRFAAVNTQGTRHLLGAAAAARVAHVVHLSSVGVMGAEAPGIADERTPCQPRTGYEISKHRAEEVALAWSESTRIPLAALRPTIVFGGRVGEPGDSFLALLAAIQRGRFAFIGRHGVANYVYVEDVVTACLAAGVRQVSGPIIVADPSPMRGFVAAAADALGVPVPTRVLPPTLAYGLAGALEGAGALLGRRPPLTRARVRALSTRTEFRSIRAADVLGWTPHVGYREGLRRTVDAYRRAGALPAYP